MKKSLSLILLALALCGCGNMPKRATSPVAIIQNVFDAALPASWVGDFHTELAFPGFSITIDVGNLHHEADKWAFDWLVLDQHGATHIRTVMGAPPRAVALWR